MMSVFGVRIAWWVRENLLNVASVASDAIREPRDWIAIDGIAKCERHNQTYTVFVCVMYNC